MSLPSVLPAMQFLDEPHFGQGQSQPARSVVEREFCSFGHGPLFRLYLVSVLRVYSLISCLKWASRGWDFVSSTVKVSCSLVNSLLIGSFLFGWTNVAVRSYYLGANSYFVFFASSCCSPILKQIFRSTPNSACSLLTGH
jgi:hypothetical protein